MSLSVLTLKAKRRKTWTCEAFVKRDNCDCALSDYKYRRHDRTDFHQNTMGSHRTLDPIECKHAVRYFNGTHNPQLMLLRKIVLSPF